MPKPPLRSGFVTPAGRRYAKLPKVFNMVKKLALIFIPVFILGCAAAGVPYTEDPNEKINYGYALLNQGRAIPAEKMGKEALEKFTEQDNRFGVAEAHIFLGQLYKHPAYSSPPSSEKSVNHSQQALNIFSEMGNYAQATKAQFAIANAYIESNKEKGCEAYDASLELYEKGKKLNPGESFQISSSYRSFPEMVKAFKNQFCNENA